MNVNRTAFLRSLARTGDCAAAIAVREGWSRESLLRAPESLLLGVSKMLVQPCQFVSRQGNERLAAPPDVLWPVDPDAFTAGTLAELRLRLVIVGLLAVLLRDDDAPEAIQAALASVGDSCGTTVESRDFGAARQVLAEDFVAWRGCGRDLGVWFVDRFLVSRLCAI
jgi:hypothetical protein